MRWGILVLIFCACTKREKAEPLDLKVMLAKPLLVGASITNNHGGVASPGRRLALENGGEVKELARSGAKASEIVPQIQASELQGHSAVVGVDLFFWDSTEMNCDSGVQQLKNLLELTKEAKIPLILGNIPRLKSIPAQMCRRTLNEVMEDTCVAEVNCTLVNLNELYSELAENGVEFRGTKYSESQMLPDGLHLSDTGADFVAEELMRTIASDQK